MTDLPLDPIPAPAQAPVFTPHPDQLALDAAGRIGRTLPCVTCGYNLRGLAAGAETICPECGTSLLLSLQRDVLRFSDPRWVRGLASGVGLILLAIGLIVGAYVLLIVLTLAIEVMSNASTVVPSTPPALLEMAMAGVLLVAGLGAMVLNLVGTWKLTAPDPGRRDEPEGVSVRVTARWTILIGWLLYAAAAGLSVLTPLGAFLSLPAALLLMAGFIAILIHLRRLALRIPDRSLGGQTAFVMWGFVAMWGAWLLMLVLFFAWLATAFIGGSSGLPNSVGMVGGLALGIFGCLFSLASLVIGVWLVVLLVLYRIRFARAAEEARVGTPVPAGG